MHYPLPTEFDIVICGFPDRTKIKNSPNAPIEPYTTPQHYCLVLGSRIETHEVIVAYGTSQNTSDCKPNEFVISLPHLNEAGLTIDTKWIFKPDSIAKLVYGDYFFNPKKKSKSPVVGNINSDLIEPITKIVTHHSIQRLLEDLTKCNKAMLPPSTWQDSKYFI